VLLKTSSYLAISTYGVIALVATVVAVVLPIETVSIGNTTATTVATRDITP
jgi:hypothetical protein